MFLLIIGGLGCMKHRKEVLRMMSYGVYILTTKYDEEYSAATITWVSQASFEPPMLSVCLKRNSGAYLLVKKRREFILHMLNDKQKDFASKFFSTTVKNNQELNGQKFELINDLPILNAAPSYVCCSVLEILENGDHPLFLCLIKKVEFKKNAKPLDLNATGWKYGG